MALFFTIIFYAPNQLSSDPKPSDNNESGNNTQSHEETGKMPEVNPEINKGFLSNNKVYRQELIATHPAPKGFMVNFVANLTANLLTKDKQQLSIVLHYMPDRWIIRPQNFHRYLYTILPLADEIETFLLMIMDDLNNQLVPRWLLLSVVVVDHDGQSYKLMAEDQQPGWSRPAVVNRILLY